MFNPGCSPRDGSPVINFVLSNYLFGIFGKRNGSRTCLVQTFGRAPVLTLEVTVGSPIINFVVSNYLFGIFGKRNGSRTCLVQIIGRAGTDLGRDGLQSGDQLRRVELPFRAHANQVNPKP